MISCITAAFAPLITKKFSSSVFGFGGGGGSGVSSDCSNNPNFGSDCTLCVDSICLQCDTLSCSADEYKSVTKCSCKKCSEKFGSECSRCNENQCIECVSGYQLSQSPSSSNACIVDGCRGPNFMQIDNLCITRVNMGDNINLTIPSSVKVVQSDYACNSNSERCCWQGQTASDCDNTDSENYSGCYRTVCDWNAAQDICSKFDYFGKTWRLPTREELSSWKNNSVGLGMEGLQLCDYTFGTSAQCNYSQNCKGAYSDACYPAMVWSGEIYDAASAYNFYLRASAWNLDSNDKSNALSVRCVADMTDCREVYGENCKKCDKDQCLECDDGYELASNPSSSNACIVPKNPSEFDCSGDDFMKIGDLCVTKKNIGDGYSLLFPTSGPKLVPTGTSCASSGTSGCCWQGNTSGSCSTQNGTYSGCFRTVCNWVGAKQVCENITYGGLKWRLPRLSEMNSWMGYSYQKGENGLQLCTSSTSSSYASGCPGSSTCNGASSGSCYPFYVWSDSSYGSYGGQFFYMTGSSGWYGSYTASTFGASVRCVADLKQSCSSMFGEGCIRCDDSMCKTCDDGYTLTSNPGTSNACTKGFKCEGENFMKIGRLCVTKKNMGDVDSLPLSSSGITSVRTGTNCNAQSGAKCCWSGVTSSSCTTANGSYSGCYRTVCNWSAAKAICDNLKLGGYTWRLPTLSEMNNWMSYSYQKADSGLQLCTSSTSTDYAANCPDISTCSGASSNYCYPYYVWSDSSYGSYGGQFFYMTGSSGWYGSYTISAAAASVRCVAQIE